MNATETTEDATLVERLPDDLNEMTKDELRAVLDSIRDEDVWPDVPKSAPKAALVESVEMYRRKVRLAIRASLAEAEQALADTERVEDEIEADPVAVEDEEIAEAESQALALREEPVVQAPALLPSTAEFDAMMAIAEKIASTQIVPVAYRGKPDDVLAAILTGREMGLGPMQSTRDIYVIDGKPTFAAHLLLSRMRQGGLVVLESESTAQRAWIRARRRDTGEIGEAEWTIEEAREATTREKGQTIKLAEKTNWRNYPADMLWARCVGRLCRHIGSDLIGSVMPYTSEEVQDWDDAPADSGDADRGYGDDRRAGQWIAPTDWRELSSRFEAALGQDAAAWMEELAEKGYGQQSIGDVVKTESDERKRDLWQRLSNVLRAVETTDAPNGVAFLPDPRPVIQKAFYDAFDGAVAIVGPPWALGPVEAEKGMPQRGATGGAGAPEDAPAADPSPEAPEAASAAEDAPGRAPDDDLVDRNGDPIKF